MINFHMRVMNTKTLFVVVSIVAAFSLAAAGFASVTPVLAVSHLNATSGNMSAGNMTTGDNMTMTMADNMTAGG